MVAKFLRPKKSPTRAQVTELTLSEKENKMTKRVMCQSAPLLHSKTLRPQPPSRTPVAPIFCFDQRSPSHPVSGRTTTAQKDMKPTKKAAVDSSNPFQTNSGTRWTVTAP